MTKTPLLILLAVKIQNLAILLTGFVGVTNVRPAIYIAANTNLCVRSIVLFHGNKP